jgi:hypothetical protein
MLKRLYTVLTAGALWTACGSVEAGIVNAKSVSLADVGSAIASARDGDTVAVPPGTASWTSPLEITKGITLQGAGDDKTVILDDLPRPERWQPPPGQRQPEGAGQRQPDAQRQQQQQQQQQQRQEWRQRDLQRPGQPGSFLGDNGRSSSSRGDQRWGGRSNPELLRIEVPRRQSFRLTGFTFRSGSVTGKNGGAIRIRGTSPSIRVDHCHFDQLYTETIIQLSGWLYGVVDHCIFDMRMGGSTAVWVSHQDWGGPDMDHPTYNDTHGHGSWADPSFWGSEKFIFVEDNMINNLSRGANTGTIDGQRGGRFVVRHNVFHNTTIFYHGTDSGAGGVYYRGTRAAEIYNNTFESSLPEQPGGQCRGGPLLWHDNKYTGPIKNGMGLKIYRLQGPWNNGRGWGAANGTSPWDLNDTEGNGTNVPGHKPHLYLSGKHTGANNSDTLVVADAGWKPNQWVGYSVTNTTTNIVGFVTSNTTDTMTLTAGSNAQIKFNSGDEFSVYKILVALDQPGRGRSDYIGSSDNPRAAWPHQALEPCYSWNNTLNGSNLDFAHKDTNDPLRENVDFYNNTPMPGYKPYTYPHPLAR